MVNEFNKICSFRKKHPGYPGSGLKTNDPELTPVINNLESIRAYLLARFSTYKGQRLNIEISKGQANFPSVLHIVILPPNQTVSNGIYAVICFDIEGRGALVGCAESITNPKGLNTVIRKKRGAKLHIDVDGLRPTTKYNNTFGNPKEFYADIKNDEELLRHLQISLDLAFYNLGLLSSENLAIKEITIAGKNELDFNPNNLTEAKEIVARQINARRGQKKFRNELLKAYNYKCAITGCEIECILEAAHIIPYNGKQTNHVQNGILMRSDVHVLFDLGLLMIEPTTYRIIIHSSLKESYYAIFDGKKITLPIAKKFHPHKGALAFRNDDEFRKLEIKTLSYSKSKTII